MAQICLEPLEPFNYTNPNNWRRWKLRFQQFLVASGNEGGEAVKQVSTLLYCQGEEAKAVLNSTNVREAESKEYDTVIGNFNEFFRVRKKRYLQES